ncbi:bacteriohemerythrin [Aliikangiella sp. G2MR2-5]|uniref:bacteriohemerythrin n=1 Tax=Aliikangiella sp. G2MR2-5 TaxID=2788943 RepID=UPI0018AC1D6C|nr:bacteriohemerythrin [Aliikangiella sp. G2MR2-5]
MSLIEWSHKYSIGIPSIDEQHKQLIKLINQLNKAMASGESASVVAAILAGLTGYTESHFAYEEQLFEKYGYPQTEEHKKEHQRMIDRIGQFHVEFAQDPGGSISLEIMQFLTYWLTNHIQGSDREYAEYLIKKGVD